jgi:hypothetical protein
LLKATLGLSPLPERDPTRNFAQESAWMARRRHRSSGVQLFRNIRAVSFKGSGADFAARVDDEHKPRAFIGISTSGLTMNMKPILTLTMNPTIDASSSVENVVPDHKLRSGPVR